MGPIGTPIVGTLSRPGAAVRLAAALLLATATAFLGATPAQAVAPPYTALGDSYSSGVGTRSYYSDSGGCYRSSYAFPVLAAQQAGVQLTFAACSGARVGDVLNNQLGSLSGSTRYVSVSVGGNDAGFATVITACARPWPYTCWKEIDAANAYLRDTLPGRLNTLYTAIRGRAPNASVIVVGYPRLFSGKECNWASRISPGEQSALNDTANRLHTTISGRAAAHGFAYVDPRSVFDPHRVCSGSEWINGLSSPVQESYHPNRAGQSSGYTPLVAGHLKVPVPAAA